MTWKINHIPIFIALISVLFYACSKDEVDDFKEVVDSDYELKDLSYYMAKGDGIDTVTIKLTGSELPNFGNTLSELQYEESFDELLLTSQFFVDDTVGYVPPDLPIAKYEVNVPKDLEIKGNPIYQNTKFRMSSEPEEAPYKTGGASVLTLKVKPYSKLILERYVDRYLLTCSFKADFVDKNTGKHIVVNGKWKGTMGYNGYQVLVQELPLK